MLIRKIKTLKHKILYYKDVTQMRIKDNIYLNNHCLSKMNILQHPSDPKFVAQNDEVEEEH